MWEDVECRLCADCCCKKVEYHDTVTSTNDRARQLADQEEPEGTLVIAEEQTAGRGRRGRGWDAGPGVGIWMSLLLRPQLAPQQAAGLTLVAALAVADAIRRECQMEAKIKWPNDIVLCGRKVCGILTETSLEPDRIRYAVVGIGINVNTKGFSRELSDCATSLFLESGQEIDRPALTAAVMNSFTGYYARYLQAGDLSPVCGEYDRLLVNRDRQVRILRDRGQAETRNATGTAADGSGVMHTDIDGMSGIARGIALDGSLLVETERGLERVVAGEVSVRGVYGYTG